MKTQPDYPAKPLPLTVWEKRIIGAFIERYPASAAAVVEGEADVPGGEGPEGESAKTPRPPRLRPDKIFPGLDRASPDDRESFLEAAESLEKQGLLSLLWARHRKGETISALICRDPELLYGLAGKPSPKTVAEDIRRSARLFAAAGESGHRKEKDAMDEKGAAKAALFSFIADSFTTLDAAGGIDIMALMDLACLIRFLFDRDEGGPDEARPSPDINGDPKPEPPGPENLWRGRVRGVTTRALSAALYGDSKRLEALMTLFNPLFSRARRQGIPIPDFSFLDRAYPETFIAGEIAFDLQDTAGGITPLVNAGGNILGLPLETILKFRGIRPLAGEAAVLMIENKETFFALAQSLPGYACFLYAGGHPNRAVRALVTLLAESGFTFSHAGDLDPDGILILQELAEIAGKGVQPLGMDADTFDRYLPCGRKLEPSMLKRTAFINERTRSIPGITELIRRIEETGMGVEQEIIDYRK